MIGYATETTYEYKFCDKGAVLGRMERHLGMYVDRSEISGPGGRAIELNDMSKYEIARRIAFALHNQIRNMEKKLPK